MKNFFSLFLFIILFSNCKSDKKEEALITSKTEISEEEPFVLNVEKIDSTQFPKAVKYKGFVKNALRWKDKLGDNIVIITETGYTFNKSFKHDSENSSDAEIFAYHFLISGDKARQMWRVYDFVSDCPVDIEASFIKNTFQVTDLNKDGIAEIWLMYKIACHGDISPSELKVVMYEENQKYAMRGENKVEIGVLENGEKQYLGGEFKWDGNFKKGPKIFKEFAEKLWSENVIEKWED